MSVNSRLTAWDPEWFICLNKHRCIIMFGHTLAPAQKVWEDHTENVSLVRRADISQDTFWVLASLWFLYPVLWISELIGHLAVFFPISPCLSMLYLLMSSYEVIGWPHIAIRDGALVLMISPEYLMNHPSDPARTDICLLVQILGFQQARSKPLQDYDNPRAQQSYMRMDMWGV